MVHKRDVDAVHTGQMALKSIQYLQIPVEDSPGSSADTVYRACPERWVIAFAYLLCNIVESDDAVIWCLMDCS